MTTENKTNVLKDLFIRCEFDASTVRISFTRPKDATDGTWAILAGKKRMAGGSLPNDAKIKFEVKLKNFTPWSLDNPFLYTLVLKLGQPAVKVEQTFGMRKFHTADGYIFMNNIPVCIRGVIRGREAHDHPNLAGLDEVEYYAKFIRAAKKLGFNCIRFHSRIPPPAYFEAANRLGILTHVEARRYFGKYQKERELMDHDPVLVKPATWRNTILSLRNHPSLMAYCLGNEINSPGRNPEVAQRAAQVKRLDPTALFIDTCARGEYDRGNIDFDVQHMGYFAPFGKDYHMYETTDNWTIFGSAKGLEVVVGDGQHTQTRRALNSKVPVLAHEVGHNIVQRDIEKLRHKFKKCGAAEPWWLEELFRLRKAKGLDKDASQLVAASRYFQQLWYKTIYESIRRSPLLGGLHFLQLADTERYENANGLLDCFDDLHDGVIPEEFLCFNGDSVILADLPRRTFFAGERVSIPIILSHFSPVSGKGKFEWALTTDKGKKLLAGKLDDVECQTGVNVIARVLLKLPAEKQSSALKFKVSFNVGTKLAISNSWNLWSFVDQRKTLPKITLSSLLDDDAMLRPYRNLKIEGTERKPHKLVVANRFTPQLLQHLAKGGDVFLLYRIAETRDRKAPRETLYLPATWDRFKPVIWDRGHNLGAFTRPNSVFKSFPAGKYLDFQFAGIVNDCDKICLDDFPVAVAPIIQGVDKAVRDRYDVFTFKLSELQPGWSQRKFAYLFDLKVGRGRLMVCGFNLTGAAHGVPEACGMLETLLTTVASPSWKPTASIAPEKLLAYLKAKGRAPRIKERMMTQYWQLDDAPLESAQFWKEAEAWIRSP